MVAWCYLELVVRELASLNFLVGWFEVFLHLRQLSQTAKPLCSTRGCLTSPMMSSLSWAVPGLEGQFCAAKTLPIATLGLNPMEVVVTYRLDCLERLFGGMAMSLMHFRYLSISALEEAHLALIGRLRDSR